MTRSFILMIKLIPILLALVLFIGTLGFIPIHRHLILNGVPFDSDRVDTIFSVDSGDMLSIPILVTEWAAIFVVCLLIAETIKLIQKKENAAN